MTTYVIRDGILRDKATGEPSNIDRDWKGKPIARPFVRSDLQPYSSPIDGREIGSRSAQREELKRHDLVLAEPRSKPRGYRNPEFARKRGLPMVEAS